MPARNLVYVATQENGIHVSELQSAPFSLRPFQPTSVTLASSFCVADSAGKYLYAVHPNAGKVGAYAIGPDGDLSEINITDSGGSGPCHLAIDSARRTCAVANYNDGVALFSLRADGGLTDVVASYQPVGRGPNTARQAGPHPHGVTIADDLIYVTDLGLDAILALRAELEPPSLTPLPQFTVTAAPGAGPRHFTIHPEGLWAASVNELDNTVSAFRRDPTSGQLTETGSVSTLPSNFKGETYTAEIGYHPNGKICYATNRGHDSLAVFALDRSTGVLTLKTLLEKVGKYPQHFAFDSSGSLLLIANASSGTVVVYGVDPETGWPGELLLSLPLGKPMCLALIEQAD